MHYLAEAKILVMIVIMTTLIGNGADADVVDDEKDKDRLLRNWISCSSPLEAIIQPYATFWEFVRLLILD